MPDNARRRRRARSASADIQEEDDRGRPTFFEEVPQRATDDEVPEFEPVAEDDGPAVDWEGEERHMQRRWEDLLEDLFGPAGAGRAPFDVVVDGLRWADGEVIWEGMDFEQVFGNPDEFRAFEQMDAAAKRKFLREKLLSHQASGAADAGDTEIERAGAQHRRSAKPPARPRPALRPGGPTMPSKGTTTERRPGEMESGLAGGGRRHRRHRGAD